ncbi:MAG: hypothetical protein ACRD4B_00595, partial [Acidobacteriota bacterium]
PINLGNGKPVRKKDHNVAEQVAAADNPSASLGHAALLKEMSSKNTFPPAARPENHFRQLAPGSTRS